MLSSEEHDKRMALYGIGLNDSQIAKEVCVPAECIRSWRRRNNLKPNWKVGEKAEKKTAMRRVTYCQFCQCGVQDGTLIHCEELDIWMKKKDFCSYGEVSP